MRESGDDGENRADGGSTRPRRLGFGLGLIVVAVSLTLHFWGIGDMPFHTKGEPREAVLVQDLLSSPRKVLPLRNGYEMPRKPPMFHWLGGMTGFVRGVVDETTVRLPSAIQSCLAALLLLGLGAAVGHPLGGFYAALVLLTNLEWMRTATSARIDMSLALGTTASFVGLALFSATRRTIGLVLLYGGMIWGTLAKGPIGIILPTLSMLVVILLDAGLRWLIATALLGVAAFTSLQLGVAPTVVAFGVAVAGAAIVALIGLQAVWPMRPIAGYLVVAGVTGAWYALASRDGGDEFIRLQILAENFGRFFGTAQISVGHEHGPFYLVGSLASGFLPWTLFLPAAATMVWRGRALGLGTIVQHCLVWLAVVFGFFAPSSSKRSVYLLPLYPAASMLIGTWLARVVGAMNDRAPLRLGLRILGTTAVLVGGAIGVFSGLQVAGLDLLGTLVAPILDAELGTEGAAALIEAFREDSRLLATMATGLALTGLLLDGAARKASPNAAVAALFAVVFTLLGLVQRGIMPAVANANTRRELAQRVEEVAAGRPVVTTPELDYGLTFYMGGALPVLGNSVGQFEDAVIVVPRSTWLAWPMERRDAYEPIGSLSTRKHNNQPAMVALQPVIRRREHGAKNAVEEID